jgi:hypothetical protein
MERFWESTPKGVLEFEASRDYFSEEEIKTLWEKTEGINDVFPTCDCKQGAEDVPYYCQLCYAQDDN